MAVVFGTTSKGKPTVIYRHFEYVKECDNRCGTAPLTVWTFVSGIQREIRRQNAVTLSRLRLEKVARRQES